MRDCSQAPSHPVREVKEKRYRTNFHFSMGGITRNFSKSMHHMIYIHSDISGIMPDHQNVITIT